MGRPDCERVGKEEGGGGKGDLTEMEEFFSHFGFCDFFCLGRPDCERVGKEEGGWGKGDLTGLGEFFPTL